MFAGLAAEALPCLAKTILPSLGVGALSGVGSALAQKTINKEMGNGLYLTKGSNIAKIETDEQGSYLKTYSGKGLGNVGSGIFLKQEGQVYSGGGLFSKQEGQVYSGGGILLGPNSPLKNIPVLGWLLQSTHITFKFITKIEKPIVLWKPDLTIVCFHQRKKTFCLGNLTRRIGDTSKPANLGFISFWCFV